jgi:hypothetical protein
VRHHIAQKKRQAREDAACQLRGKTTAEQHLDARQKLLETYDMFGKSPKSRSLVEGSRMLKELVRRQGQQDQELKRQHQTEIMERMKRNAIDIARTNQRFEDKIRRKDDHGELEIAVECGRIARRGRNKRKWSARNQESTLRKRTIRAPPSLAPSMNRSKQSVVEFLSAPSPEQSLSLTQRLARQRMTG